MEAPISYQILSGVYGNGTHKFKAVRQPSVNRPWSVRLASAYRPSTSNMSHFDPWGSTIRPSPPSEPLIFNPTQSRCLP